MNHFSIFLAIFSHPHFCKSLFKFFLTNFFDAVHVTKNGLASETTVLEMAAVAITNMLTSRTAVNVMVKKALLIFIETHFKIKIAVLLIC